MLRSTAAAAKPQPGEEAPQKEFVFAELYISCTPPLGLEQTAMYTVRIRVWSHPHKIYDGLLCVCYVGIIYGLTLLLPPLPHRLRVRFLRFSGANVFSTDASPQIQGQWRAYAGHAFRRCCSDGHQRRGYGVAPVSYTHLTLPTICSV